ncbi:MAG: hypothetical protein GY762_12430 [Proteobacteria bacterium]|nr:hypothetical protein [Pseudomonadota bacterium]
MRTIHQKQVFLGLMAIMAVLVSPCIYGEEAVQAAAPDTDVTEPSAEPNEEAGAELDPKKKLKRHLPIINYSMAMPVGSTYDFVSDYSFRGVSFEYRYLIMPVFSVGALIGWSIFDDKVKGDNVPVSETQVRWMDALSLAALMHAYLPMFKTVLPFAGLELGAYYASRYVDAACEDGWHFGLAPEIGTLVHVGSVSFNFSVKFKYLVETNEAPEELFFGFNVGLGFLR